MPLGFWVCSDAIAASLSHITRVSDALSAFQQSRPVFWPEVGSVWPLAVRNNPHAALDSWGRLARFCWAFLCAFVGLHMKCDWFLIAVGSYYAVSLYLPCCLGSCAVTYRYVCVSLLVLIHLMVIRCSNSSLLYITTSEAGRCTTAVLSVGSPRQAHCSCALFYCYCFFCFCFFFCFWFGF